MKLIWHGYLVFSLGICVHETPTETGLIMIVLCDLKNDYNFVGPYRSIPYYTTFCKRKHHYITLLFPEKHHRLVTQARESFVHD